MTPEKLRQSQRLLNEIEEIEKFLEILEDELKGVFTSLFPNIGFIIPIKMINEFIEKSETYLKEKQGRLKNEFYLL